MSAHLTYTSYLQLDQVLGAQHPQSEEHDEMLFIVIHQVYELWFKQILHELDHLQNLLRADDIPRALKTCRRVLTILKTVVTQIDILETMTPLEFDAFRHRLQSSSGFQSSQFRELEFVLGNKRWAMVKHFEDNPEAYQRLEARYQQPTLWDAFLACLAHNGYAVPERDITQSVQSAPELHPVLVDIYRHNTRLAPLCERLLDIDEGLQEWRYRHVKMVERTIGTKKGTGGSAGVDYLRMTLAPFFPDLWHIRSML